MSRVARTLAALLIATAAAASVHARPSRLLLLPGTVTVLDGSAIPSGSILRISLHDLSPGDAKDPIVANQSFDVAGKTPIHFELSYNPSVIEPSRMYGIAAVVTDSRGQALWETRVPIRVLTLGNQTRVQLVLRPAERPEASPEPTSLALDCDRLRFHVDLSATSATVLVQDSKIVLPMTEGPSGKRYSDGTTTLAMSGSAAYFQWQGKAYRDCMVRPESESKPKP